jgi:NADH:ubiquinone oxidoreductase subunit 5 (subunit L)/multisubunit Na+/H+ antiporter MnhA subunit
VCVYALGYFSHPKPGTGRLAGFVLLGQAAGAYRISELPDADLGGATVATAAILILVGAFTKSALGLTPSRCRT